MSRFELHRFEATPVAPAVAVVEVTGEFSGVVPSRPRLLVERGGVSREVPALEEGGAPWSAVFAVPLAAIDDPEAAFSLVPGRGPLIALPAPSSGGEDDRFVRLARTANDLRHRLGEATENAAAAAERLAESSDERDRLVAELAAARDQLAAAETRATEAHEAAVAAREEQARAEGEADAAREEATRAAEEARAAVREDIERAVADAEGAQARAAELQDRVVAAEDEAHAARRDLRDTRARLEALQRETRTARIAAARSRVPSATPDHAGGEFHAARLSREWTEGDEEEDDPGGDDTAVFEVPDEEPPSEGPPAPPSQREDASPAPDTEKEGGEEDDAPPTESLDADPPAGEPPTTGSLEPVEPVEPGSPELWRDDTGESVRVLRPRTRAGRLSPAPPPADPEDAEETGDDVLDPAAVGARTIQPAELSPRQRAIAVATNPRVIVGVVFALLILALILIFNGVGLV